MSWLNKVFGKREEAQGGSNEESAKKAPGPPEEFFDPKEEMFEEAINQWLDDFKVRFSFAEELEGLKDPKAVGPLLRRLSISQDRIERRGIIIALKKLQFADDRIVRALMPMIADADGSVSEAAIQVLYGIDPSWAKSRPALKEVPHLILCLEAKDPITRKTAAWALGKIGDRRAITPLALMSRSDPESYVRLAVVKALAEIDPKWRSSRG